MATELKLRIRRSVSNTGLSRASNVVTVDLASSEQTRLVGDEIVVSGCTPSSFNGTHVITEAVSATQYKFAQIGSVESTTVHGTSGGDYSSLSSAEAAEGKDITVTNGSDEYVVFECYDDWADGLDDAFIVNGFSTIASDADNYVETRAAPGHESNGELPSKGNHEGFFVHNTATGSAHCINLANRHCRLTNIGSWRENGNSGGAALYTNAAEKLHSNCVFEGSTGGNYAINSGSPGSTSGYAGLYVNCFASTNKSNARSFHVGAGNRLVNCMALAQHVDHSGWNYYNNDSTHDVNWNNCVSYSKSTLGGTQNFNIGSGGNVGSKIANGPGTGNGDITGLDDNDFVDAANDNWKPAASGALDGTGVDQDTYTTVDIVGTSRTNGSWEIGPWEIEASGGATGDGDIVAGAGQVSGTAQAGHDSSGALAADAGQVSGTAQAGHAGSGALVAGAAQVSGAGTVSGAITGEGDLAAGTGEVSGTAQAGHGGSGDLAADAGQVSGTAQAGHDASGALTAGVAQVSGAGVVSSGATASGDLVAGAGQVDGSGEVGHVGSGALAANDAAVSGSGQVIHIGTGALIAGPAEVSGSGAAGFIPDVTGSGALVAGAAQVSGTGQANKQITGSGALVAGSAILSATGQCGHVGVGTLVAELAQVSGSDVGFQPALETFTVPYQKRHFQVTKVVRLFKVPEDL